MKSRKIADLCVVIGTYTDETGSRRNRYENIGIELQNPDGGTYFILKPYINLAGFPSGEHQGILVTRFPISSPEKTTKNNPIANEAKEATGDRELDIY